MAAPTNKEIGDFIGAQVHPLAAGFPLLDGDAFELFVADIKANGQIETVKVWKDGGKFWLLDGRNRVAAAIRLGWLKDQVRSEVIEKSPDKIAALVASWKIHSRYLKLAQRKELVAALLKADPAKSDRAIAKQAKLSPTTIGKIRALVQSGHVQRIDSKGRKVGEKPARSPKVTVRRPPIDPTKSVESVAPEPYARSPDFLSVSQRDIDAWGDVWRQCLREFNSKQKPSSVAVGGPDAQGSSILKWVRRFRRK